MFSAIRLFCFYINRLLCFSFSLYKLPLLQSGQKIFTKADNEKCKLEILARRISFKISTSVWWTTKIMFLVHLFIGTFNFFGRVKTFLETSIPNILKMLLNIIFQQWFSIWVLLIFLWLKNLSVIARNTSKLSKRGKKLSTKKKKKKKKTKQQK